MRVPLASDEEPIVTRIVRTAYRYWPPPRRRQAAALEVPAVVKAVDPAKASKRARSAKLAESAATVAAPDVVPSGDRVAPSSAIVTIRRSRRCSRTCSKT